MSFLPPNEQNQLAPQGQTTPNPASGGAGAGAPPPAAGGSAGMGAAKGSITGTPTQFGSSASKLGDYLSANAPQIQGQANQVAGNLNTQYGQVGTDITNAANQFGQQVQGGYTAANPNLVGQAAANPTQFAQTPGNVAGFQAQLNNTYTGPKNFESTTPYSNIQNEVNQAVQNTGLMGTQAGLQSYFQGQGGNQTRASSTLDALLMQNNPQAQQTIQTAANQFQNLTPQLTAATIGANQGVTQAQQNAANASKAALEAFTGQGGALTNLNQNINKATADKIAQQTAAQKALAGDIGNLYGGQATDMTPTTLGTYGGGTTPWYNTTNYNVGSLSPQSLAQLGITPDQAGQLQQAMQQAGTTQMMTGHNFGAGSPTAQVDLNQYLQSQNPAAAYTNANMATPEQYQQMAAIQQLLGAQNPTGNAIDPTLAAQAGTAPALANNFNYQQALNEIQGLGASERQAGQEEANALTGSADLQHAQSQHTGGILGQLWNNPLSNLLPFVAPTKLALAANKQANK